TAVRTRPSGVIWRPAPTAQALARIRPPLGREFSPARADCRYREPLAPRLARSRGCYQGRRSADGGSAFLGLAQPAGEHLRDLDRDRRMLLEQRRELPGSEPVDAQRRLGDHRRAAFPGVVEQGHLAGRAAPRDRPEALAAGLHPGRALGDHEEANATLALDDDGVSGVEPALLGGMRDGLELTVGQPFEE